jgi:hypothetical protein
MWCGLSVIECKMLGLGEVPNEEKTDQAENRMSGTGLCQQSTQCRVYTIMLRLTFQY